MSTATEPLATRWSRPLGRSDRRALALIVIVPTALFVVPALFGHPGMGGDNLIQNFPLRVLSGRQIASGHLPLLNPYSNSGTPLLGGLNAGSLYPMTVIFAFVPAVAAWLLNLIAVYVTAALGVYALLRWHGLRSLASLAAALSYTYTGAMIGQIVHLGVVQGFSFIPWTVLILLALSRRLHSLAPTDHWRRYARAALPATMWFAVLWGLTFLTGEPRAIAVIELLCLVSVPVVLVLRTSYSLHAWRARITYVLSLGVGLAWGVAIGLVQLLPGESFIGLSERSSISYGYYGAGSLAVRWSPLMLVQDLFGGNGTVGRPHYFVNYNLPEVTGYAGLLALVAVAAFLTRLTRRGWVGPHRDFVLYVVLGVVGLFATWGSFTPLGHLFHAIPLFGHTRLQSRNIIVVDFAAAMLLGWWLDRLQARDPKGAGLEGARRWFTLAPPVAVVVLCLSMLMWGPSLVHRLGASTKTAYLAKQETLTLLLHLGVALSVIALLVWFSRSTKLVRWLLAVMSVDVALFLLFCSTGIVGTSNATEPSPALALSLLGNQGRTALVDLVAAHSTVFNAMGLANLDVFTQLPSVQGYGSLISSIYDNATGSHPLAELDPCQLGDGTFTQLRLASIAIATQQLGEWVSQSSAPSSSCLKPVVRPATWRYFGQILNVRTVTVTGYRGRSVSSGPVTVQLLNGSGRPVGRPLHSRAVDTHVITFVLNDSVLAGGFRLSGPKGVLVNDVTVSQGVGARSFRFDTPFQQALSTSAWRLSSTDGTFAVIKAAHVLAPDWLYRAPATSRITKITNASWGDTWVSVTTEAPVVLVRSEAYLPGWRATALNAGTGQSLVLGVDRSGLVQKVTVPSGTWVVHFHYHAPYIEAGLASSLAGGVVLLGVSSALPVFARRKRKSKVRP
ncbi:MAG: hypothetical protein WA786_05455 [Acidimicrobiales bacterium]